MRTLSPSSLARASARHPWRTLAVWIVIIAAALVGGSQITFTTEQTIDGAESQHAEDVLERFRGERTAAETIIVSNPATTVDDPAFAAYVDHLAAELRALEGTVTGVIAYTEVRDPGLVSPNRQSTILVVSLAGDILDAKDTVEPVLALLEESERDGFELAIVGDGSLNREVSETFERDLRAAEMYGLPAALIVLFVVFGAAVAAGVPVLLGILGILVAVGITGAISLLLGIDQIVVNLITMIGLAVGIDYTLFIVERFREERAAGRAKVDAIVAAGDTASRAVLFSGITVIIALAGLLIVPANIFRGMAIGSITVVVAAVAIALTLLPAVLGLLGDNVNRLGLPGRRTRQRADTGETGFFAATTRVVMKHPLLSAGASILLLLAAAAPYATIRIGSPSTNDLPHKLESVQAFELLERDFAAGRLAPTDIVLEGDVTSVDTSVGVANLRSLIEADPAFAQLGTLEVNETGTIGHITVLLQGDTLSQESYDAIRRLRDNYIPRAFDRADVTVSVGGGTASTVDYIDTMERYLPIVIAFVLSLSFVLLMMVFHSIVIPVKAIIMNLLSVGAAYGLVVLVFQHGVGADLLGFQQTETIAAFLPVFMFAILFGLSMDYHVFLLSRIQERFHETRDNAGSVSHGLRSTAHIITGAAAIMMVVFGGFALGDMVELQQTGFGLAVAVFLDATIVRSVLVPASMELLGERNWYLPAWLGWLPKLAVEGGRRPVAAFEAEFDGAVGQ